MSHSTISARCRPGKPWQRPIPGVIVLNSGPLTRQQLSRAALVHAGPDAMVTGIEAARLHGIERLPGNQETHVLIPHESGVASWGFAIVERTIHLPEPVKINDLPVAPLPRALFDAARRMDRLADVRAMIKDAVGRGLCDPRDLQLAIAEGSTIGSGLPRRVVHEIEQGIRSAAEAWLRNVVQRSNLPEPECQIELRNGNGASLGFVHVYWATVGLAWQIDYAEFHLPQPGHIRDDELTAAGVVILHTSPSQLRDNPRAVVEQLRAAYRYAASRPPPAVMPV
jgi:hypothetical protein